MQARQHSFELCQRLGIRLPIIQAPMAGASSPAMAKAVSLAGGLGSLGHAYTQPEAMRSEVAIVREGNGLNAPLPLHINLFVDAGAPAQQPAQVQAVVSPLTTWFEALGLPVPTQCDPPYAPVFSEQVATALALRPTVLSCHLNPFSTDVVRDAQRDGIVVAGSATNVSEALALQDLGFDLIIAQSSEAGGHRGTFIGKASESMIGTMSLVRMLAKRVRLPVIAAGGIMDGAGVMAALTLGASAAQLGTAFLNTPEALTSTAHRQALTHHANGDSETAITIAFSGRPAQGIRNGLMAHTEKMLQQGTWQPLPFPAQNKLTGGLRAAGAKAGNREVISMWAGQAHPLTRELSSVQLCQTLEAELRELGWA